MLALLSLSKVNASIHLYARRHRHQKNTSVGVLLCWVDLLCCVSSEVGWCRGNRDGGVLATGTLRLAFRARERWCMWPVCLEVHRKGDFLRYCFSINIH